MGQSGSNMAKKTWKIVSPAWWKGSDGSSVTDGGEAIGGFDPSRMAITPFVFTRHGSMYFDEDGDLAHEFYEEVKITDSKHSSKSRTAMKRLRKNLTPQGEVPLPVPRLNADFPIVICEAPSSCR